MKKSLSVLLAALVILSALGTMGIIAAEEEGLNVDVGSYLKVEGVGVMDSSMLVQSELGYAGQRLSEDMYSAYRGTAGVSNVSYTRDMNIFIGTSDTEEDVETTDISYASTVYTTLMKRKVCSQNYEAGVVSSVKTAGISNSVLEIDMTPSDNYLNYEGELVGKAKLSHMVVDPTSRLKVVKEVTDLKGAFGIDFNAYAEKLVDVGDEGDWLGCP
jgi:hypothetical protein